MFITKHLKQWRLLPARLAVGQARLMSGRRSELNSVEQYEQFLELVKADLEERKHLFFGRPATASCGASVFILVGGEPLNKQSYRYN